jgi:hypothetical protein
MKATPSIALGICILGAVSIFTAAPNGCAQENIAGHASDFTTTEYYDAPHQQQVKSRLSGTEAQPQPGGLLDIKQFKIETFGLDGKPEIIASAPDCTYDTFNGTANSPGHLQVRTGDGKFRVDGDGFLWRQNDSFLAISNNVHSMIDNTK